MAVGALAGLAIQRGVQPRAVPAIVVQDRLARDTSALALQTYADVPHDAGVSWGDIQVAATYEIMAPSDAGVFDPSSALTRGASAVVLENMFAFPPFAPTTPTFADVPQSRPDYAAIEAIYHAGLTTGCGGGNFCPDIALQRGQMATFVVKALAIDPSTAPPTPLYLDVALDGGASAEFPFIQIFGQKALLDPCAPNMFCPSDPITRAQTAQVVRRVLVARAP
jgi:hypothetical protein